MTVLSLNIISQTTSSDHVFQVFDNAVSKAVMTHADLLSHPPLPFPTTSSLTFAIPLSTIPSSLAAEPERSTTLPGMYGPRSLTRTVTDRPVATFVTLNRVPNGKVR